jgi:hypothetical protein
MPRLRDTTARAVNRLLARTNLAVVRRDRHDALAASQVARERQALGRDARPLHEAIRTFDPATAGTLMARTHDLADRVVVLGRGRDAQLVADALAATGRTATLLDPDHLDRLPPVSAADADAPAPDVVVAEPTLGLDAYDLVRRLRVEQGRRVFTADQLLAGAALFEAVDQLIGIYIQPRAKAIGYMTGAPIWDPIARLDELEPLAGKRVVEFGPLDGCMTGSLVESGVASVTCVEVRLANVLKVLVARQALGWANVEVVVDDMHNVDGRAYGTFDVVVAHGVYYHSATPLHFLQNLTTLGPVIFLGGYCTTPEHARASLVTLQHGPHTVRAQPFREKLSNDGAGVHPAGYYVVADDLVALFDAWGFDVEVLSLEPTTPDRGASHYIHLLARQRPGARS